MICNLRLTCINSLMSTFWVYIQRMVEVEAGGKGIKVQDKGSEMHPLSWALKLASVQPRMLRSSFGQLAAGPHVSYWSSSFLSDLCFSTPSWKHSSTTAPSQHEDRKIRK